jgi:hypothetical protein
VDSYTVNVLLSFGGILLLAIIGTIVHIVLGRRPPSKLPK